MPGADNKIMRADISALIILLLYVTNRLLCLLLGSVELVHLCQNSIGNVE